jgi:hypothetical protein
MNTYTEVKQPVAGDLDADNKYFFSHWHPRKVTSVQKENMQAHV